MNGRVTVKATIMTHHFFEHNFISNETHFLAKFSPHEVVPLHVSIRLFTIGVQNVVFIEN